MLIYVLLIFFAILMFFSYFIYKKDVIHPSFIFNLMFFISVLCAIYNIDKWGINIRTNTFIILIGMALLFNIISFFISRKYRINELNKKETSAKTIKIEKNIFIFAVILNVIYMILIIVSVRNIALKFGNFNTYSEALTIYKSNVIYSANAALPIYVRIINKFIIAFSYVYMFIAIYNYVNSSLNSKKRKLLTFLVQLLPTIIYAISLLLQSSRGMILRIICAGVIIYIILWYKHNCNLQYIKSKYIAGMFTGIVCMMFAFYSVSAMIGRSVLKNDAIEYITMYGGGSIQLFDIYVNTPPEKKELPGSETFWGLYRFLDDYNIVKLKNKPTGSLEWRKSNGYSIGNVYTGYRRWMQDFGIIGCAIILGLSCVCFNLSYIKIRNMNYGNKMNIYLIIYSYIFYHLLLISIDCRIFDEIIPSSLSQFLMILLLYYVMVFDTFSNHNSIKEDHKKMRDDVYDSPLEELNKEFINLYDSEEYNVGKKVLIVKYYLKKFKFITLIKKIYRSMMKKKNSIKNNYDNDALFINNDANQLKSYKGEKVAIYTVNIGGYDFIQQPILKKDNADYYYVSDKKPKELGKWKWIDATPFVKDLNVSNVKKARFIKTHPHLIFKEYKYSIFIDGNIKTIDDICTFVNHINKKTKIAIHPHPFRECIYDEAKNCKRSGKGNPSAINRQIELYEKEGMPHKYGLFETNVVVRQHNDDSCKLIMEKWWDEIRDKSERDQLSLTYVLWKNGFESNDIGVICDSIKNNYKLQVLNHADEYKKEK